MQKAIIYGAGTRGKQVALHILLDYEILAFIDTDSTKQGSTLHIEGKTYSVLAPQALQNLEFDTLFIGTYAISSVKEILASLKIPESKINTQLADTYIHARIAFINNLAQLFNARNIQGACAELGVHRGDTARHINRVFPSKKLYLLDTFEGFDERDCAFESQHNFSTATKGEFGDTSLELVKSKMPHLEQVSFIKGYFPSTKEQIPENEKFCFVNIDVDLYQPILAGCEFFYPRLTGGGILLIDDYFNPTYEGTKKAVDEFAKAHHLTPLPIGDSLSVCFIKKE
ncbi:TylF/MycF/NovP-related O-methyltransferase [Helicobacter cinaedi]|uniref:TylF/MycF/NovP-related O-methyltransferase n=2 Tax=Helicobacter cinaedi TaxID=213 RepID=UPI000DA1A5C0|nr:TylF/MycF/NovP-related O-methyltransferase [Helicobacter cinaedi]